jgi:predicted SnoaL-like aldol condensation-catalyzing enzyme
MRALGLLAVLALAGCGGTESGFGDGDQSIAVSPSDVGCIRDVAEGFKALFYDQGKVREAYETFVAEDYKQHNPMAADGREAAITFLEGIFKENPQQRMTVHHMIVEDPYIAVHLHGQSGPDDLGAAAVDILRVEDCKIVEHWDVTQAVPAQTVNGNGMF